MLRQFLIFAFALSMMLAVASSSSVCVYRCMACFMISTRFCAMDAPYPNGGAMCLDTCRITEAELPRGGLYETVSKLKGCRSKGGDIEECVRKVIRKTEGAMVPSSFLADAPFSAYDY